VKFLSSAVRRVPLTPDST